jgi:hypothetical protein
MRRRPCWLASRWSWHFIIALIGLSAPWIPADAQSHVSVLDSTLPSSPSWSAAENIRGIPAGKSIRSPSLARHGDSIYIAGNLFPVNARADLGPRPAIVLRVPGNALALPPGEFGFGFPKGVIDRRGTYHLFWSESTEPASQRRFRIPTASSLWYAALAHGVWTTPQRLVKGSVLNWTTDQGTPVLDDADRLHVVLTASLDGTRNTTLYLRRLGRRWEVQQLSPAGTYATIVPWHSDTLVAVFIAPDRETRSGGYSIYAASSTDAGTRWSQPQRVASSGAAIATATALVIGGRTLHLLWAQSVHGGSGPGVLRHLYSIDAGMTWDAAEDGALLREGEIAFVAAASACGATAALIQSVAAIDGAAHSVVDELRWTGVGARGAHLFPEYVALASPALTEVNGTFHLVAAAVRQRGSPAVVIHATRPSCSP